MDTFGNRMDHRMNRMTDEAQGRFQVLHSSAGAGKTHNLVKHYLLLALKGRDPAAYTHILALTFTNKAAAEMRERVLKYLEDLGGEAPLGATGSDVRDSVMRLAGIDERELRVRAKAMHSHMLHHWSQVAISTIDSFVRRVVKPFARELQLDHELRMTTDEDYYRGKAVELLLEDAGTDPALTRVLVETCEQLLENEQSWRPDRPLRNLAEQLGKESAIAHLEKLRETPAERFMEIQHELKVRVERTREHLRHLGQKVMKAVADQGLTEDDFPYKSNGYISFYRKLAVLEGNIETTGRLKTAVETGTWTANSTPQQVRPKIEALKDLFEAVFLEAESLRKLYTLDRAVLKDLLPMATLNSIGERLEQLKQEEGVSFFSDLTRKVHAVVQEEPAPFIYERLGEWYRHFLVDEFQDTSLMQWHAMLPLVHNALSSGGSVLLVGDAKQAIYRWRNGEARQFVAFPNVFRKQLLADGEAYENALLKSHEPMEPLANNFRSGSAIIAFNNRVTGRLMDGLGEEEKKVYDRHEQNTVLDREGYVEVATYSESKDADAAEEECPGAWRLMKQAVQDSLEDGFRPGDIAVLVRTGKQGREASGHLRSEGWNVVSPDGLTLGGHAPACAVIEVLSWLHMPVDEHAARAVQAIVTVAAEEGRPDPFPEGTTPATFMRNWTREHRGINPRLPLVPLITRVASALGHDAATDAFIMALVNEAHAFSKSNGDDLPGFLEKWELSAKNKSVGGSPGAGAIQVMTVHKAKGLQFPVVIIPDAGKKTPGTRERIWINPDPPMEGLPTVLVGKRKDLLELGIPEMDEEDRLGKLDDLDVLYVALTRPEQRLYISIPEKGNESFGAMLRDMLVFEGGVYRAGRRERKHAKEPEPQKADGTELPLLPAAALTSGERTWKIRKEAPDEWDPSDPDPYRSQGKAVHAILARVRTAADLPTAIRQERDRWGLPGPVCDQISGHLQQLLGRPAIAPFFREGLEVFNERALLQGDGSTIRPDRVVRDNGVFHVLDIKTGRPMEDHHRQVQGYVRVLQALENAPVHGWLLYAAQGELVPVEA